MPQASAEADQAGDADPLHQPAAGHHQQDLDGDALAPQQADGDVGQAGGAPGQRAEAVEHRVARLAEARGDHEQQERPGAAAGRGCRTARACRASRWALRPPRQQAGPSGSEQTMPSEADIEHPGRAVAVDRHAADHGAAR